VTPRLPQDASAGDLKTPTGPLIKSQRVCRALTNGWEMFNEMQAKGARHAPRIRIFSMSRPNESSEEMDKPHSNEYK
jgi:hypothetical protein